jgi:hypothetical protein
MNPQESERAAPQPVAWLYHNPVNGKTACVIQRMAKLPGWDEYIETPLYAVLPEAPKAPEWKLVPVEPSPGLLVSMAIRADHALGVPGYYDQPMMQQAHGVGHAQMLESTMRTMRQLHEEVVGTGFYRPEKEAEYAKLAAPTTEEAPKE